MKFNLCRSENSRTKDCLRAGDVALAEFRKAGVALVRWMENGLDSSMPHSSVLSSLLDPSLL